MIDFIVTILFFGVIYAISFVIAIPLTKRRLLFSKRMVIGKDSEEIKEELKSIASSIMLNSKIPSKISYELNGAEVNITKNRDKVICVRVESQKTIVTLKDDDGTIEETIVNKGFSERAATALNAFVILGFMLIFILFLFALYLSITHATFF